MVLFKRKQITFLSPPLLPADANASTPVWVIPETGEWFVDYETYLDRMSFYNIKKFVCETSGNSNFTFFEALKVEHNELFSMQSNFPEPVKEPILRFISFSTVPRIDQLVDQVYSKFKDDYFPGDKVVVKHISSYRAHGVIKEKVVFNSRMDSNGIVQSPFISYRVFLPEEQSEIDIENPSLLYRERNRFTKSYVKTFLKMSLTRSNRIGAPWVIKEDVAKQYKISLDWPPELKQYDVLSVINNPKSSKALDILNPPGNEIDSSDTDFTVGDVGSINSLKRFKDIKPADSEMRNSISQSNGQGDIEYGMKSTRGFSHTVFENLKETPPASEDMVQKWCQHWYQILQRTTAYFEDLKTPDAARDKVLKLFQFTGVHITDKFDPNNTHFIVTKRPFAMKVTYPDHDPFSYVHVKRIKVWHYEKCQRFFKSIKISNRKIYQLEKQHAIEKGIEVIDSLNNEKFDNSSFVKIAPAHLTSKVEEERNGKEATPEKTIDKSNEKKSHKVHIVDDLGLPSKSTKKPKWKQLEGVEKLPFDEKISMSNVIEVWMFINMFHNAFIIDTFTFDDFMYALQWKDSSRMCPLLVEIFCSLLSAFMNEKGELQITPPIDISGEIKQKERELKEKKKLIARHAAREEKRKIAVTINGDINDEDFDDENHDDDPLSDDEEIDDEEEINHNAYSVLDYKKVSWRERLQKRDFKNGHWLIILLGIFSISEYIPDLKSSITEVYEILSPIDETPTPSSLLEHFYRDLDAVKRVSVLSILMILLIDGNIIRAHTESVVERSTNMRREKLEIQKEIRTKIESAHNANKDVLDALRNIDIREIKQRIESHELELLKTEEEKEKFIELKNKGGRPIQNILPPEPSALEKAVAAGHPEFLELLNIRCKKVKEIEELKKAKLEIDRTLVELNCQRIRFLGKDRVWNRYWWFERNGLPNLGSNKDDDGDDDENEEDDEDDDMVGKNSTKDDDDSDSEYDSETYLMGRLWIQGPNHIDQNHLHESQALGMKRKIEEEGCQILRTDRDWVYIDEIEDFDRLITSLNDKGVRERLLKKELNDCKEGVYSSFNARKKFLTGDDKITKLIKYIENLESGMANGQDSTEDALKNDIDNGTYHANDHDDDDFQGADADEGEEYEDEEEHSDSESLRRSTRSITNKRRGENSDGFLRTSKRPRIVPEGKNESASETKFENLIDQLELPDSNVSVKDRNEIIMRAHQKLENLEKSKREENLIFWVNSSAIENLGHSHYEGPPIVEAPTKTRASRGRGRGRGRRIGVKPGRRTN